MTKEEFELIKLSDLNREDNIKYISSEAQGIAIALDSDRYAPTLCKLERAYICGRRKSEKRISDLEKENKLLGERCNQLIKDKGDLTDRVSNQSESLRIIMLEEEKKNKRIAGLEAQVKYWKAEYDKLFNEN